MNYTLIAYLAVEKLTLLAEAAGDTSEDALRDLTLPLRDMLSADDAAALQARKGTLLQRNPTKIWRSSEVGYALAAYLVIERLKINALSPEHTAAQGLTRVQDSLWYALTADEQRLIQCQTDGNYVHISENPLTILVRL